MIRALAALTIVLSATAARADEVKRDDVTLDDCTKEQIVTTPGAPLHLGNEAPPSGGLDAPIPWSEFVVEGKLVDPKPTVHALLAPTVERYKTTLTQARFTDHVSPAPFTNFAPTPPAAPNDLNMVLDIPVQLTVELGRTRIPIKNILQLAQGSVVELETMAGEPMDVLVNGYLIAQGEVVVVNEKFGVRLTDIVTPSERMRRALSRTACKVNPKVDFEA